MSDDKYANSIKLYQQGKAVFPGGTLRGRRPDYFGLPDDDCPIYYDRTEGSHIWDVDGNEFIDWMAAYGAVVLGYRYRKVDEAAIREAERGFISTFTPPLQNELAEKLIELIPCAEMVRFFKTGSEATTAAVRTARMHTGRDVVLKWGYAGWHDWCYTDQPSGIPTKVHDDLVPFEFNDLNDLESKLDQTEGRVACVIMMPFDHRLPEPGYLEGVRRLTQQHGVLLIFDEMRTGFRAALGGAQEYFGVTPDLATFGKAMANGYALAALVGKKEIMDLTVKQFSNTFGIETMAMAASLATIAELETGDVIPRLWEVGERVLEGLSELIEEFGVAAKTVGYPCMPYLVFNHEDERVRESQKRTFFAEVAGRNVFLHANHHWFSLYTHTDRDVEQTLQAAAEAFQLVRAIE